MSLTTLKRFLILLVGLSACRSGHFEKIAAPAESKPIEVASPDPVEVEKLSATLLQLESVDFIEKSPEQLEVKVESRIFLQSSKVSSLRYHKIAYEILFPTDAGVKPIQGTTETNGFSELTLLFSLPFSIYENERIQTVKVILQLNENRPAEKAEILIPLNFYQNRSRPAVSEKILSLKPIQAQIQKVILSSILVSENKELSTYRVNDNLQMMYLPIFTAVAKVNITRMLLGHGDPELAPLKRVRMRSKIFAIDVTAPNSPPIYEQVFPDLTTDSFGDIRLSLKPSWNNLHYGKDQIRWIFAFELPTFPKVEKAFFEYDPDTQQSKSLSHNEAFQKLDDRIYDLTTVSEAKVNPTSSRFSSKSIPLNKLSIDLEEPLKQALLSREAAQWILIFKIISDKTKSNISDFSKWTVTQWDRVQSVSDQSHQPVKRQALVFRDELGRKTDRDVRTVQLKSNVERCLSFGPNQNEPLFHYCFKEIVPFEFAETWQYYYSPDDTSVKFLTRGTGNATDLNEVRKADILTRIEEQPAALITKIYP